MFFNRNRNPPLEMRDDEIEVALGRDASSFLVSDLDVLRNAKDTRCTFVPTGFEMLDSALDGGFYNGLYILGAMPSIGKTTFIKQVADQIAAQGQDVLFFSLEMARAELIAKSISRHSHLLVQGKREDEIQRKHKTTREIMLHRVAEWETEEEKMHIKLAYKKYEEYAGNIFTIEGEGETGCDQIRAIVKSYVNIKEKAPVVIVDYLQILAPGKKNLSDKQITDKAVVDLKRISRDYGAAVICISSFNRNSYYKSVGMDAFKESGSIEYSSDVLLGLQYDCATEKGFDVKEAARDNPRKINLAVIKNRNGEQGTLIAYDYYPAFNYFEEVERCHDASQIQYSTRYW